MEAPVLPLTKNFEDPAILSVGRKPQSQAPAPSPVPETRSNTTSRRQSAVINRLTERDMTPAAELVSPMQGLGIANGLQDGAANGSDGEIPNQASKKRRKRRIRKSNVSGALEPKDTISNPPIVSDTIRGPGWRQTPLLEPNPSFQPFSSLKKPPRKGTYDNGWATEDATDVQDMGDFDFAANLSKFDKKTVFDGIRTEDMTADEDRLVGHNRLPKPGTAGGKNLHYTENVLDGLGEKPSWISDGDSDAEVEAVSRRDTGSGRTSRRAESRLRKPSARKDTSVHSSQRIPVATPALGATSKSSFYLVPANRRCEVVSALQMLNLENIADGEFGLTEDMMTENAARGIAEVALSVLKTGGRRLTQDHSSTLPHVLVYAGNNKSGLRAVAAARHLRNHNIDVVVVVLGLEREAELLEGLRRQLKVFRSFGGKVFKKPELMEYMKTLNSPVDLIIDGLLGLTISFEELRTGDQATAYELIEWANRSKASSLAIDVPTGIEPTSGKVSIIDGKPLYIHADYVVAMGAPKKGLLQAMMRGEGVHENGSWQLFVADIGIANQAWKKAGTRMRRGLEFEGTWVVGMRFQKGID